ncbi:MAG: YhcH/YjgK/YiaL family protein [Faecalibacterium sp.]
MIYDTLNNLPNYLGMSEHLDAVIEYIMARDITTLPAGRTRIDDGHTLITVSTLTPQTSEKVLFQRHDAHLTLETDLEGSDLFEVSLGELTVKKPYDPVADTAAGSAGTSAAGMLCEGRFTLFLAGEPYRSGLKAQGCGKVKKAVFFIELDEETEDEEESSND